MSFTSVLISQFLNVAQHAKGAPATTNRVYKYSSTLRTISRIWNGRPFTFEKAIASTKYFARTIVQSWPRFISGIITVSNPASTSPRFFGKGFRYFRCAAETLLPSACSFSTAVEKLQAEGKSVSAAHLKYLNPFPKNLGEVLAGFETVIIPEMNLGQLCTMVRAKYLVDAVAFSKVKGRPFQIREIVRKVEEYL